jgi:adenylosuccinate synthase
LLELGVKPLVYADQNCRVTTPFDVALNQLREMVRGEDRHGSCGSGFGETVARYEALGERARTLTVEDASVERDCAAIIDYFKNELQLITRHGVVSDEQVATYVRGYYKQFDLMMSRLATITDGVNTIRSLSRRDTTVIFEGAQGLLLHQDHPHAPHVTWCRTGLEDVVNLLGMAGVETTVQAHYCTRSYVTRHGAGPLQDELPAELMGELGYDLTDETNQPNPWQGTIRYAPLDTWRLGGQIVEDLKRTDAENPSVAINAQLVINNVDQAPLQRQLELALLGPAIIGLGREGSKSEVGYEGQDSLLTA